VYVKQITGSNKKLYFFSFSGHMLMLLDTFAVPPRWLMEPVDHSVVQGNPVSLHCQVDGFPKPTVTWKQAVGMQSF
jgi:hypothetical protein